MAIIAREKGTAIEPITEGVHTAVCIMVIDLGEQWSEAFQKTNHKVMITWEVTDESTTIDGEEKPRVISKEYTLSLSQKATLRNHLEAWRGKKFTDQELDCFDMVNILGTSCQLQILHNDKGCANVAAIMAMPKNMPKVKPKSETVYFDLSTPECLAFMDKLPEWVQDKIKKSEDYKALIKNNPQTEEDFEDESLPF